MSALSDKFRLYWKGCHGPALTPEYRFHPSRRWRFDFALPERRIAFEVEGIVFIGKSRHTTPAGYSGDCSKYNEAVMLGWRVFRFTGTMIRVPVLEPIVKWAMEQ